MVRRQAINIVMIVIIALIIIGTGGTAAEPRKLTVTYNPMPFNLPSMVEQDQGLFRELGLDVTYNAFAVGYAMTEAMEAKELDIAVVMGGTSAITSRAGGRDIQIVAAYSQAPQGFALVGLPGQLDLSNLEGKRISVPLGTEAHYLLGKILAEQGLTFKDITVVNLLVPDGVAALQGKHVDGAMVVEPVLTRLVHNNQIAVVRDGEGLMAGLTVSVARRGLNPSLIEQFLQAQEIANQFILNHRDQALEIAARATSLPLPLVQQIAPKYTFNIEITDEIRIALADTIDFLYEEGIIRTKISVDDLF